MTTGQSNAQTVVNADRCERHIFGPDPDCDECYPPEWPGERCFIGPDGSVVVRHPLCKNHPASRKGA